VSDFTAARSAFTSIYNERHWGEGSGIGSAPENVMPYLQFLQDFLINNHVSSVVDIGCGDWQFSRLVEWGGTTYSGFDVVESVVARNTSTFGKPGVSFHLLGGMSELPSADLVLVKDVLQHLPLRDVQDYLGHCRRHYKFALITNDIYPDQWTNVEIGHGAGRALRLDLPPFNLPAPVVLRWEIDAAGQRWVKATYLLTQASEDHQPETAKKTGLMARLDQALRTLGSMRNSR
jgi:SAM-dependent methyltransferase